MPHFQHVKLIHAILVSMAVLFTLPTSVSAKPVEDSRGTFSFVIENDTLANTDRNYTNGVRISYMSGTSPTGKFSDYIASHILGAVDGWVIYKLAWWHNGVTGLRHLPSSIEPTNLSHKTVLKFLARSAFLIKYNL